MTRDSQMRETQERYPASGGKGIPIICYIIHSGKVSVWNVTLGRVAFSEARRGYERSYKLTWNGGVKGNPLR